MLLLLPWAPSHWLWSSLSVCSSALPQSSELKWSNTIHHKKDPSTKHLWTMRITVSTFTPRVSQLVLWRNFLFLQNLDATLMSSFSCQLKHPSEHQLGFQLRFPAVAWLKTTSNQMKCWCIIVSLSFEHDSILILVEALKRRTVMADEKWSIIWMHLKWCTACKL